MYIYIYVQVCIYKIEIHHFNLKEQIYCLLGVRLPSLVEVY
jgi:hypothetical protein